MNYSSLSREEIIKLIVERFGKNWTLEDVDEKDKDLAMAYFAFLEDMKG